MTTTNGKEANGGGEKRVQTIMLGVIMLIISWQFKTTIESGQDIAAIKVQLNELQGVRSAIQPQVNQLGLDANKLRLDVDNTMRRVSYLETEKR